jgi:ribosomal protein S18 acetylase RimI-like enzyme
MLKFQKISTGEDELLAHFTYLAIYLPEGVEAPPLRIVYDEPLLRAFFHDFGTRKGDIGVAAYSEPDDGNTNGVATADGSASGIDANDIATDAQSCVGAAWLRIIPGGYGHVDTYAADDTPELAIAVEPEYRSRGIGTRLLDRLFEAAAAGGWKHVSLSVQKENRALHLYERMGFKTIRDNGDDYIMVKGLSNN